MKKQYFLLVSLAAILALGGCGKKENKNNDSSSKNPLPPAYVDPEVNLTDLQAANMEISFDAIENNCMVNPKAQAYIDAMEEQEKTLDKPYHFSSLYGPDDYAKLAAASDSGDGKNVPAANKGGVDVCEYLSKNDDSNDCKNFPIKITWDDDGSFANAKVKFWSTEDQSDIRETNVSVSGGKVTASLENLFRATKYRVQVFNGSDVSNSFEFKTGDYPRTITMGGIHNVRDLGGYVTSYGVRTNQGLIYRGYYIDDKSGGHGANWSDAADKVQKEVMKIGYEIDLQKTSETNGRTVSCLNSEEVQCDYKCLTLVSYASFLQQDSYKNLPEVMSIIANSDQKHSYFHCWGGADRTGMLAFFINAICGVSYTDLIEDFELTSQTNNKRCHAHNDQYAYFPKFLNAFMNEWAGYDDSKTVNENCERWMVDVAGVNPDHIERIREIMLPGYADGELKADTLIPNYTPNGEWKSDDRAHWKVANEDSNVKCEWHTHDGAECSICGHGGSSQTGDEGGNETDPKEVFTRVWIVTKTENNSDGKEYQQIKDNSKNKVGVKILFTNYSASSTATVSDGKLNPQNDSSVYLEYKVKAPKAGTYQLVMNGRVSDSSKTLSERHLKVVVNGTSADIQGDRTANLGGQGDIDFVAAPSVQLTGNEDTIRISCPDYRIAFNLSSYLLFAEH